MVRFEGPGSEHFARPTEEEIGDHEVAVVQFVEAWDGRRAFYPRGRRLSACWPGFALVNLLHVPDGLNAEALERFLRESGAETRALQAKTRD